ncbi:HTH_Tnp_Tc3_2 domain-containing protein [Nephila pilipes]|uniref:HTH_Tnp_Tc3_2 domain-containing protein n=1 Tax=Nephila pilipes TaxID=299642 RepID=A0A8X6PMU3_NEPPI|nr:HTH_Tnp_Tc3_2 domain-containing protein [Nephila pilipes]
MPRRKIRGHYEQLPEFLRGRIIGLKKAGWANRRMDRHMGRSDGAIRKCLQEWVDNGRFQRHDGNGRLRAPTDREDRVIVRSAVTAPDSSLPTIRLATHTRVSTITLHRWLIERNLRTDRPLPLMPAHCRDRLHWLDQVGMMLTGDV